MNDKLNVNLGKDSYPIIWRDTLDSLKEEIEKYSKNYEKTALLTNVKVYKIYEKEIKKIFSKAHVIILPDGEKTKSLKTIENVSSNLLKAAFTRNTLLIGLGGGVIGDINGFVASIYMRGISFIQIPTTLLSMVDSSVGGKTGVNLPEGKNMIGTFQQPKAVFIIPYFLKTLPARERKCGLAEAIKSALLMNKSLFYYIEQNKEKIIANDLSAMKYLSKESVAIKAAVVEKDEKEKLLRGILNLGHTLAHAIESYYEYKAIKHGEAVSIGLAFAAFFSYRQGILDNKLWLKIFNLLQTLGMPCTIKDLPAKKRAPRPEELVDMMKKDKKNRESEIYFVMLKNIGEYLLPRPVDQKIITKSLKEFYKI
ncbi:MAG: 3-dehydroquinate synthase [Spirochaetia bacterium]|nr:3-dehydroquinate synthase [Spirochaetia bacterium]